jgi:hypothetical protein
MKTKFTVAIVVLASTVLFGALTPVDSTAGQKSIVGVFDAANFQATVTGTVVLTRITFGP